MTQKREVPKLRKGAVPMFLPNRPSYLSATASKSLTRLDKGTKERTSSQWFFSKVWNNMKQNVKFRALTLQDLRVNISPARLPKDCLLRASSETLIYFIKPKVLDGIPTIMIHSLHLTIK